MDDYKSALTVITGLKKDFFSHTQHELKPMNFILRKILKSFDANDVTDAMKSKIEQQVS